jgi:excisionase family DNA binding protein
MQAQTEIRLFKLEDVAERLALSIWTVRQYVQRGVIPSVKIGQRRLVRSNDLNRIACEGLKVGAPEPSLDEKLQRAKAAMQQVTSK